ncbi:hypothetical protein U9M48_021626 [Paspalum notatum var. saurae]|uniref:protein-serine/threonine phosphatase n=1 Tax=Paspalum notatum var. saurae TaxID=547442 RepID=A0AAQ3WTS9_PASNO
MLTKLRPFARGFLEKASAMFEMYVCALADEDYERAVVKLLDPDGVYFGDDGERVVSSEELKRRGMKSLVVIPGAEAAAAAVILDDTDTAWPSVHQDNLILVDRYLYFASAACRRFNHSRLESLVEQGRDEGEDDGSLAGVLDALRRVHKVFFDGNCSDVRDAIREVRRQVLHGCTVVFRRSDEGSAVWSLAERFGAVCQVDVSETATHVVAEHPGTQKAQWARDNNKFLVNQDWIKAASFRWCRQGERAFPVLI